MSRSLKKGPFIDPKLEAKVVAQAEGNKKSVIKTWSRASTLPTKLHFFLFHSCGAEHHKGSSSQFLGNPMAVIVIKRWSFFLYPLDFLLQMIKNHNRIVVLSYFLQSVGDSYLACFLVKTQLIRSNDLCQAITFHPSPYREVMIATCT